jgi:hypothetical protein
VVIGAIPNPQGWERWEEAKAYLEPARQRGSFEDVIEADEALYVVLDGDELLACATAWLSTERYVEVKLVGGRDRHRWLSELNDTIGRDARGAGATRLIAIGRRGWLRELRRLGWDSIGETDDQLVYARGLGNDGQEIDEE